MFRTRTLAALVGMAVTIPIGAAAQAAGPVSPIADPAASVNPFIGTTNVGNTYPGAVRPFGMLAWSPQNSTGNQISTPAPGGYQYAATKIRGLQPDPPQRRGLLGRQRRHPDHAVRGRRDLLAHRGHQGRGLRHRRSRTPTRPRRPVTTGWAWTAARGAELTVTDRTGIGPLHLPRRPSGQPAVPHLQLPETGSQDATVHIDAGHPHGHRLGHRRQLLRPAERRQLARVLHACTSSPPFDQPFATTGTWKDGTVTPGAPTRRRRQRLQHRRPSGAGKGSGGYVTFAPRDHRGHDAGGHRVRRPGRRRGATSAPRIAARRAFDAIRAQARAAWDGRLPPRSRSAAAPTAQRTTFYTALYHSSLEPDPDQRRRRPLPRRRRQDRTGSSRGQTGAVRHLLRLGPVPRPGTAARPARPRRRPATIAQSLFNYATQRGGEWDRWLLENGKTSVMSGDPSAAALAALYAFGGHGTSTPRAPSTSLVHAATVPTANDVSDKGCNVECFGQRPALAHYL